MPYAIGKTATIRNGKFIPGGTKFEVSLAETESLKAAGFEILEDSPKSGNINNTPEVNTGGKTKNTSGKTSSGTKDSNAEVPVAEKVTPMGGTSSKAKVASKVSSKKEN